MRRLLVVLALLLLGSTACGGGGSDTKGDGAAGTTTTTSGGAAVITIKGLAFTGADTVKAKGSLTIRNEDGTRHTFTPDHAGDFQAAALEGGKSATIAMGEAGTYAYHCDIHSTMKGTITVEP
jgi:plastocyanin